MFNSAQQMLESIVSVLKLRKYKKRSPGNKVQPAWAAVDIVVTRFRNSPDLCVPATRQC